MNMRVLNSSTYKETHLCDIDFLPSMFEEQTKDLIYIQQRYYKKCLFFNALENFDGVSIWYGIRINTDWNCSCSSKIMLWIFAFPNELQFLKFASTVSSFISLLFIKIFMKPWYSPSPHKDEFPLCVQYNYAMK